MVVVHPFAHIKRLPLRLMERDNKKARDDARKEYNETVRVRSLLLTPRSSIAYIHTVVSNLSAQT